MPTLTIEQFGQKIKAKYPEYKDMSDADLGSRMLSKFPEYKDMVSVTPTKEKAGIGTFFKNEVTGTPQEEKPGILGSIFQSTIGQKGILGVVQNLAKASAAPFVAKTQVQVSEAQQRLADATINAIKIKKTLKDPNRIAFYEDMIGQNLQELQQMGVTTADLGKLIPTLKEVAGAGINAATTVGGFGLPGAAKVGLPKAIAATMGLGAASGAGVALSENEDFGTVAKQALVSGLLSGGTYGVLLGAGKVGRKILEKAPEALMTDAMRVSKKVIQAGKNPAKLLVEENQFGGMNPLTKMGSLLSDTQNAIDNLNFTISDDLAASTNKVPISGAEGILRKAISDTEAKFGTLYSRADIKAVLEKLPIKDLLGNKNLSLTAVNEIRSQLGSMIGDSGFRMQSTTLQKNLLINVWKATKNAIVENSDDPSRIAEFFAREEKYIKANQAINSTLATLEKNTGISFTDKLFAAGGFLSGDFKGAIQLIIGNHLLTSPNTKILAAQLINSLNRGIESLPTDAAGKISKTALIKFIGQATESED